MYTIKGAAAKVGISAPTLRAWERRYGIVEPTRTDGGYRIYSAEDVIVLGLMANLVSQGRPPSLAAAEAKRQRHGRVDTTIGGFAAGPSDQIGTDHGLIETVVDAAAHLDASALAQALDDMFGLASFETVVDTNLLPAMKAIGEAWAAGRVSVAGEHLAANAVMRRLSAAYEAAAVNRTGPRVLIGMAPGGTHELGLFAFAVAARRYGINTAYLGANLPVEDWTSAFGARDVVAAVLTIPTKADVAAVRQVVRAANDRVPPVLVAVGGAEQDQAPVGVVRLGHQIGNAASALALKLESASFS